MATARCSSKRGDDVRLRSRNDRDLAAAYPRILGAGRRMRDAMVLLDGEVVAVDRHGVPSFQALQHRGAHPDYTLVTTRSISCTSMERASPPSRFTNGAADCPP